MKLAWLQLLCFAACFIGSFSALSGLNWEAVFSRKEKGRIWLFLFLASLALGYLSSQAILMITVYNGL